MENLFAVSFFQKINYLPIYCVKLPNFYSIKKWMRYWKLSRIILLKLWHYQITWHLFAAFKTIIFCSLHSMWFMKYRFSAEIWFVKTSTRVVRFESRVIKLNSEIYFCENLLLMKFIYISISLKTSNILENRSNNFKRSDCTITKSLL